jgi:hypothetical protein
MKDKVCLALCRQPAPLILLAVSCSSTDLRSQNQPENRTAVSFCNDLIDASDFRLLPDIGFGKPVNSELPIKSASCPRYQATE